MKSKAFSEKHGHVGLRLPRCGSNKVRFMNTKPSSLVPTSLLILQFLPLAGAQIITYTDLSPPPPLGTGSSDAYATTGGQQAGSASIGPDFEQHAIVWSGTAASFVSLNPLGALGSGLLATTGSQQAGFAFLGGSTHAGLWSGTAASFVDLHPIGASFSTAYATSGSQQAGYATFGTPGSDDHAALWSGTAASFVDLNPAGAAYSYAYSTAGGQQVGAVNFGVGTFTHAALWSGTASSFVDLNPTNASAGSYAHATTGSQQAGWALLDDGIGFIYAGIWSGTPESFVSLKPPGITVSYAFATTGEYQVGQVFSPTLAGYHAAMWHGTAESFVDLDTVLGSGYGDSRAEAIWTDGSTILIAGHATYAADLLEHAILWRIEPIPEPGSLSLLAGITLTLAGFIRRRA